MLTKNLLKEEIIEIDKNKTLLNQLGDPKNFCGEFKYVYLVYDKDKKYLIKAMWGDSAEDLEKWRGFPESFGKYVKKTNPKTLGDYMFFLDAYERSGFYDFSLDAIYNRKFKKNNAIDEMLADSRGFLLWHYQLENLIGFFFFDNTKQLEVRKGLQSAIRRDEYMKEAKKMKFTKNLSLYDIITERIIHKNCTVITRIPRWIFAYNLYNALNVQKKTRYGKFRSNR